MIGKNKAPAGVLADRVVKEIEYDLTDRRGFGWDDVDKSVQREIRATWHEIVLRALKEMGGAM